MAERNKPSDAELRQRLSPEEYAVTQEGATEPPFTGRYWNTKTAGTYSCVACGEPLFSSATKYESGSGWPSFYQPLDADRIAVKTDNSRGMVRTEALCGRCGAHLGHVFPDGPQPTGERYCMNSLSLKLEPDPS